MLDGLDDADVVVGTRFHPDSMYFVGGPRRWAMVLLSKTLSRMNKGTISDPTSGFRSAGPKAIDLFAVEYPADYLGDTVGSLAIAIRNGLVIHETPVTMYFRQTGRPEQERRVVGALPRPGDPRHHRHEPEVRARPEG